MKRPSLLLAVFLLLLPLLAVPAASAPAPGARAVVELSPEHSHVVLSENRRAEVTIHVKAWAEGFACVQPLTVNVDTFVTFGHEWAGASMNPHRVGWTITIPGPILGSASFASDQLTLEVFWGENHPAGAHETYEVHPAVALSGGPCLPAPLVVSQPTTVTVWAPGSHPHGGGGHHH